MQRHGGLDWFCLSLFESGDLVLALTCWNGTNNKVFCFWWHYCTELFFVILYLCLRKIYTYYHTCSLPIWIFKLFLELYVQWCSHNFQLMLPLKHQAFFWRVPFKCSNTTPVSTRVLEWAEVNNSTGVCWADLTSPVPSFLPDVSSCGLSLSQCSDVILTGGFDKWQDWNAM